MDLPTLGWSTDCACAVFGIIQLDEGIIYKVFAFTTQQVVIEFPERTSDCPEPKTFKTFSH